MILLFRYKNENCKIDREFSVKIKLINKDPVYNSYRYGAIVSVESGKKFLFWDRYKKIQISITDTYNSKKLAQYYLSETLDDNAYQLGKIINDGLNKYYDEFKIIYNINHIKNIRLDSDEITAKEIMSKLSK